VDGVAYVATLPLTSTTGAILKFRLPGAGG